MNDKKIMEILEKKGATLDKNYNNFASDKGFMVSLEGQEKKIIKSNIEEIKKEIEEKRKFIENKKGLFIGLWLEDNYIYIDISIYIENKTEALEIGKKNNQLAIFDLKNKDSLYLNNYNFIKFYNIYEVKKNKENKIIDYKIIYQNESKRNIIDFLELKKRTIEKCIYNYIVEGQRLLDEKYVIIRDFELVEN